MWCLPSSAAFAAGFEGASLVQSALELMRDGPYGPLPFMSLGIVCPGGGHRWPRFVHMVAIVACFPGTAAFELAAGGL